MIPFKASSLRNKLIAINMLTAVIILLLTSLAFLLIETIKSKNSEIEKLISIGNIICLQAGAELSFKDSTSAAATLESLGTEPSIQCAVLYDTHKNVFATYQPRKSNIKKGSWAPSPSKPQEFPELFSEGQSSLFQKDGIHILLPVTVSGEAIGSLYIHAGLDQFFNRLYTYIIFIICILLLTTFVAFFLSAKLQKTISAPPAKAYQNHGPGITNKRVQYPDQSYSGEF